MQANSAIEQRVIEKLRRLFPEQMLEVEEFIDSLYIENTENADRDITKAFSKLSEAAFQKIWDNPDDAEYDKL
ncbi:MAG: toxin-antitoxin system, antitoxin component, Xre family protein [Calothrix sp. FI2-JRJ7]|jgi:delta-aminolevulinic acid dehydratase/porphobilinogen synthase|nr:toxin-antitoxin system, antitoxin component, Xre family protein [Calothrix sp. FI2-JRJ7]